MAGSKGPEVADIFRACGQAYCQSYKLPAYKHKAMQAITRCRTAALGGHKAQCDTCGHMRIWYNSCRNRHCPKCQWLAKEKWLLARESELLPIVYFHTVLTIPDQLNPIVLVNQRVMYDILFKSGAETLLTLGRDPKHVGGEIGVIAVLHTWGQTLIDHPHLHCIVTGGGLSSDGKKWVKPRKMTKERDFFVHVNVISALFKQKFLYYLKKAYRDGQLKFVGKIAGVADKKAFAKLIDELYVKKWVTYCKEPFAGAEDVLRYLGNYTHRVAITNRRIVKFEDGKVSFRWRDYRDDNKQKVMTLDAFEFIRRFLLHILPPRFFKIRHYGLFANCKRKRMLRQCRQALAVAVKPKDESQKARSWQDVLFDLTGEDITLCPSCGKGRMIAIEEINPCNHSPPFRLPAAA